VSAFNTTTSPKTVSITVQTGDSIVVMCPDAGALGGAVNTAPTGGSLTYTQVASLGASSSDARNIAWTATANASTTFSVSAVMPTSSATEWGCIVWVFRSAGGFGAVGAPTVNSTSNLVTFTTTGSNSAIVMSSGDWNGVDGTTRTSRTINASTGTEDLYGTDAAAYTWYGQHYADAGAAGSVSAGFSAPTAQATASIAVEILGTSTASATTRSPIVSTGAVMRASNW